MAFSVGRLFRGDEPVLDRLAREDADFDVEGRGVPLEPLSVRDAEAYLADPNVLFWVAEDGPQIVGFLAAQVVRKRAVPALEVLLYEIGVRRSHRRRKVGTELIAALDAWMAKEQIRESWVLADNADAVKFYRACGFQIAEDAPVYLVRPPEE